MFLEKCFKVSSSFTSILQNKFISLGNHGRCKFPLFAPHIYVYNVLLIIQMERINAFSVIIKRQSLIDLLGYKLYEKPSFCII